MGKVSLVLLIAFEFRISVVYSATTDFLAACVRSALFISGDKRLYRRTDCLFPNPGVVTSDNHLMEHRL